MISFFLFFFFLKADDFNLGWGGSSLESQFLHRLSGATAEMN